MNQSQLLTEEETKKVKLGEPLRKDYFYIPVIYYSEESPSYEEYWYSLRFNQEEAPVSLLGFTSKVPIGQTLWQAVRYDLENDFNYPHDKSFVIEEAKPFDTAKMKNGNELTKLLVWVGVYEKFDTKKISPAGTAPYWVNEGEGLFNLITSKYFN